MRANAIDKSKLAKNSEEFRDLIASDADWIVRSADDMLQFRAAGDNAHASVPERDFQAFVDSLEFRNGGVSTGSYKPLMASLTISEVFEVLESMGMERTFGLETLEAKCEGGSCVFEFWSFCSHNCS
jgi:hypothetical protein